MLGCYVMQGVAGAYAAASFKTRTLSAVIAGTLFAVMMPSLMIRIPHAALNAQFLLIFMLAFYVRLRRGELSGRGFLLGGGGLLLLAATIHPYLLAMLFPLYAVALLAAQLSGSMISWRGTFAGLLVPLPLLFAVLYCLGYLSLAKGLPPPEGGFIESSMNLLSPFLNSQCASGIGGRLHHDQLGHHWPLCQQDLSRDQGAAYLCQKGPKAEASMKQLWLIALAILLNVCAQLSIKLAGRTGVPVSLFQQILNPMLIFAVFLYGLSFILTVRIYSVNELSVVAPFMAACTFVLIYMVGYLVFGEPFTLSKSAGLAFIVVGMFFLLR